MTLRTLLLYITSSYAMTVYLTLIVIVFLINAYLKIRTRKTSELSPDEKRPRVHDWYFLTIEFGLVAALLVLTVTATFHRQPMITEPSLPIFEPIEISNAHPLTIAFDKPVGKSTEIRINPEIRTDLFTHTKGLFPWDISSFTVMPKHSLQPDTEYIVEILPVTPVLSSLTNPKPVRQMFLFKTQPLPVVAATIPVSGEEHVSVDTDPTIILGPGYTESALWEFEIDPPVSFAPHTEENGARIILRPDDPLSPGTRYTVRVYREAAVIDYESDDILSRSGRELVHEFSFMTVTPASIATFSPTGTAVSPDEPLVLVFKDPMDTQSVLTHISIRPDIPGEYLWTDERTLRFVPQEGWEKDTEYTLNLGELARTAHGGVLSEAFTYAFRTPGVVDILRSSPSGGSHTVSVRKRIELTFNQSVDRSSVESLLRIDPPIPFETSWTGNTLFIRPLDDLAYDTPYAVRIAPGIRSVGGLDSTETISLSFRTAPYVFSLSVPYFKQQHMFTCYTTAVKMALSYYGISDIDEVGFLDQIGRQTIRRDFISNSWGDPNRGVVGTHDGSGDGGYGAHWDPVARAVSAYRPTEVRRQWNIPDLLGEIQDGHPVIVWWVNALWPVKDVSWNLPDGTKVYTVNGMHASVVTGWQGDRTNPEKIFINDPALGQRTLTKEQFLDLWKWFDYTAVIIR